MNSWKKKPKLLHKQLVMSAMKRAGVIEADTMTETLQRLPAKKHFGELKC